MPRQHINTRIQRTEAGLSSNLRKTSVVRNEIDHFLLETFTKVLHAVGALGEARGDDHVGADFGGVVFVVVGEAEIGGVGVFGGLGGDFYFGECWGGGEEGAGGDCGGGLEEGAAGCLFVL